MTLKERWDAQGTKMGFWAKIGGIFLMILSGVAELPDYIATVPPEIVPHWVKIAIFFAGLVSAIYGKSTVAVAPPKP